jgi:hypothetical protein
VTALIIYHQIIMLYENECVSTAFTNPVWARDFGLLPLRAVGSIYEPEAGGAAGAYAPDRFWI